MPVLTLQIGSGKADARETDSGTVAYHFADLLFGDGRRYHFLRFINVAIPQGSVINSAYLKFTAYSSLSLGAVTANLYAEKSINALPLVGGIASEISSRVRTVQTVAWVMPAFVANTQYTSGDIKVIIQEIVNQPNWQNGNAINIISDVGAGTTSATQRDIYSYEGNNAKSTILEIDYSLSSGLAEAGKNKQKDFIYKVYDENGTYLATWANEVVNVPKFTWQINGGMGQLVIGLKRSLKDFGEAVDVKFGNIVKCYIQDGDQEKGKKIWEGKINRYEPLTSNDNTEIIDVVCTSRILEMEKRLIKSGSNTEVTYSSVDPSNILKSLISSTPAGGILLAGLINNTGTTASYTFNANTIREGFDIVRKLSPQYWYFWLNADNEINFKQANFDEIDHKLIIGKHVSGIKLTKSTEELCNRVYFMGGGNPNLYKMYERTSSQSEFGLREVFLKDERVTVNATAELIATTHLDAYDHPISEIELEVVDSNIDPIDGYDIERFKPGDIVQITHPEMEKRDTLWDVAEWDVDYWDFDIRYAVGQPHQILEITYEFSKCILRLSAKTIDFQKRIEEINRNMEETAKINLPSAPS